MIQIVTTFDKNGWEEYGRRCVETFVTFWPEEYKLICYYEETPPDVSESFWEKHRDRVEWRDLYKVPNVEGWLSKTSIDWYKGLSQDDKGDLTYEFRMDANRFARKIFATYDAWLKMREGPPSKDRRLVVWLDADTYTFESVPSGFVEGLLPADCGIAYLGRDQLHACPDCSFIVYDVDHSQMNPFMQLAWNTYTGGAFVYIREWHDSYVWEMVRKQVQIPSHNIAENAHDLHAFVFSPLGQYMDHLRGPARKSAGRSPEHPVLIDRPQEAKA